MRLAKIQSKFAKILYRLSKILFIYREDCGIQPFNPPPVVHDDDSLLVFSDTPDDESPESPPPASEEPMGKLITY